MSLQKYTESKPSNIQFSVANRKVHPDFELYVTQYKAQTENSIDTQSLNDRKLTESTLEFFRYSQATLFHIVYAPFSPASYGSANAELFKFRRDGETYRLEKYGIGAGRTTVELSDAQVTPSDKKIVFISNNGYKVELEKTDYTYDTNLYTAATDPNPVAVWKLIVTKNNQLELRAYLVSLDM